MFQQINEIIEVNLQLLFKAENNSLLFSEFKDKKGNKLLEMSEFFHILENEKLIKIENNKCNLTEFGKNIVESGGWFEHIKKKKEQEKRKKIEEQNIEKQQNIEINEIKRINTISKYLLITLILICVLIFFTKKFLIK